MPVALKPEYALAASRLGLRRLGNEFCGPCPVCGGSDRFRIGRRGAYCRKCCPDSGDAAAVKRLLEAAGLHRELRRNGQDYKPEPIDHAALAAPAKPVDQAEHAPEDTNTNEQAERLIDACEAPNDLVHDYLARRLCWPPRALGLPPPDGVKWLSKRILDKAKLNPPGKAEGAMAFIRVNLDTKRPAALALMALDGQAERLLWFGNAKNREVGKRKGTAFIARSAPDTAETHIAEGEIDAIALRWTTEGRCLSVGGTSGLLYAARSIPSAVVIHADGDPDGRMWAENARRKAAAKIEFCAAGYEPKSDPASELADMIEERAAIREYDGGLPRDQAELAAWQDLFNDQINQLKEGNHGRTNTA